jgi:hypothetical protein
MPVKPLLVVFVVVAAPFSAAWGAGPCTELPADAPVVRLAGVDAAGDPVLADGRSLRLVGIAPRQNAAEAARFASEIGHWRDRELKLVILAESDRWGRLPARLFAPTDAPGSESTSLAAVLLRSGAVQRLPEAAFPDCGATPAARPSSARSPAQAEPNLVGDAIDGHDIAALKAQAGRFVAVEGRVASVGERAQRTYLNFSRQRAEAGTIMLSRKLWRELQASGWTASGLTGKRVRARGVLSGQDGTLLEASSAAALELID